MSGTKRRRIAVPQELENIESLSRDTAEDVDLGAEVIGWTEKLELTNVEDAEDSLLPTFIVNALIGKDEKVEHNECPFEFYIDLKEKAWQRGNESQYLIIRKGYRELVRFVHNEFKCWDKYSRFSRVITGTAGIGKTMFALLLARLLFKGGNVVLLYYEREFWAFTRTRPKTKQYLDKEMDVEGITIYFTLGIEKVDDLKLASLLNSRNVIKIRDCGDSTMENLASAEGRIIYFASSGQESFVERLESKSGEDPTRLIIYAELWSALECAWAAKLGLVQGFGNNDLDVDYILEGYRRFGGSVRNVLAFARAMKNNKVSVNELMDHPLVGFFSESKIQSIVDMQNTNQFEKSKSRLKDSDDPLSVYFHPLTSNFPTHDSFIVCIASCFFQANTESTKKVQEQVETALANSVVLVGLQLTVSGSDDATDKPSHSVVGQHLKDHYDDFKKIMQQHHADMNVLEEVMTVFVSPTESCRKMKAMPVLSMEYKPLRNAIPSFAGTAVQYYSVFEVEHIRDSIDE